MDLGPFKHRVDDGLELRKAAFECLDMLLDSCKDRIQFHDFIQRLVDGLQASGPGWTPGCTVCQCSVSALVSAKFSRMSFRAWSQARLAVQLLLVLSAACICFAAFHCWEDKQSA